VETRGREPADTRVLLSVRAGLGNGYHISVITLLVSRRYALTTPATTATLLSTSTGLATGTGLCLTVKEQRPERRPDYLAREIGRIMDWIVLKCHVFHHPI